MQRFTKSDIGRNVIIQNAPDGYYVPSQIVSVKNKGKTVIVQSNSFPSVIIEFSSDNVKRIKRTLTMHIVEDGRILYTENGSIVTQF